MRKQKIPPMQKSMTAAELRVLLRQKEKQLQTCLSYNSQWQEVAANLERQKNELVSIVEQLQAEKEHYKRLVMERAQ